MASQPLSREVSTMIRYILPVIFAAGLIAGPGFAQDTETDSLLDQSLSSALNTVRIDQVGTYNTAIVTSSGKGSLLALSQEGDKQTAKVEFDGPDNLGNLQQLGQLNKAVVTILGGTNVFTIQQKTTPDFAGLRGNIIRLSQFGLNNFASQTQIGNDNEMVLSQSGDSNEATMMQNGTSNLMRLEQVGNENVAELSQTGFAALPINITQSGGMRVSISQIGN